MYLCVYVFMWVLMCVYVYVLGLTAMRISPRSSWEVCDLYVHGYIYMYMYESIYIYVFMCICIYVGIYVCICIFMCVH